MPNNVPSYQEMMWPTLKALEEMGGSGSISEINDRVAAIMQLSDEVLDIPHTKGNYSSFDYRMAWARTHLIFFDAVV